MESKLKVQGPVVEIQGDGMAQLLFQKVKDSLISPFLSLPLHTYDLSAHNRGVTGGQVMDKALHALQTYGVGVKCSTDSSGPACPSAFLKNALGGTSISEPILAKNVSRLVPSWTAPVCIARHVHADQYDASEFVADRAGTFEIVFTPEDKNQEKRRMKVFDMPEGAVGQAMYNSSTSITSFAHHCFSFALQKKQPLYLSTKNTILKKYDGLFKDIFSSVYGQHYAQRFKEQGIWYEHRLIDDMVAYIVKSEGGFVWACKNYDGEVQSHMVAQGFSSMGMMVTSLSWAVDTLLAETSHGTLPRHLEQHLKGESTSSNSTATIYAWAKALGMRGRLDKDHRLGCFAVLLEESVLQVLQEGHFTKDVAQHRPYLDSFSFVDQVQRALEQNLRRESMGVKL